MSDEVAARLATLNQRWMATASHSIGQLFAQMWARTGNVDENSRQAWVQWASRAIVSVQRPAVDIQVAYVGQLADMLGLERGSGVDHERVTGAAVRHGIPPAQVYDRVPVGARTVLSHGETWTQAMQVAARLARELARSDFIDCSRLAALAAIEATPGMVGFRRVPAASACRFCLLVAGRRYRTTVTAPGHPNCDCGVIPVTRDRDPGASIAAWARSRIDVPAVAAEARITQGQAGPIIQAEPGGPDGDRESTD